jgi:hypothetical protein
MQCGEQALLPAVREADPRTVVIANGFSCKTQIQQSDAHRNALHVAQVIKMAREQGPQGYQGGLPEKPYYEARPKPPTWVRAARIAGVGIGASAAGSAALLAARRLNR